MTFALHPRLEADTFFIADWPLCRVLLMNDARFPWLILVPMREGLREIFDLEAGEQATLMEEISRTARDLQALTKADKMNIAALGNQVPQLHVHIIARFAGDAAWPNPVWGSGPPQPYAEAEKQRLIGQIRQVLE